MLKEKDWRRGRTRKENEFYTKPNNGGIIKKSLPGIDEIKQSIEAAERRAKTYENEWLDSVFNNAEQRQIDAAKTRMEQAKSSVVSLNEQLSDAYGLGEDGYWNTQRTARSVQMENNPDHAYAIGNSTTAAATPQSAYAAGTKAATAQPKTQQSTQIRQNPEHAYAIGNSTGQARTQQSTRMRANSGQAYAIGNGNGQIRTKQSQQMRQNPDHAYGIGQFDPATNTLTDTQTREEYPDAYGMFTGGVAGNYKPQELRDAQEVVDIYNMALDMIEQITGETEISIIQTNINSSNTTPKEIDTDEATIWEQAAEILAGVQEKTGVTYQQAIDNKDNLENYYATLESIEAFKYASSLIMNLTGMNYLDAEAYVYSQLGSNGKVDGVWAQVNDIINKAEEETGSTYLVSFTNKTNIEKYLEKNGLSDVIETDETSQQIEDIQSQYMSGEITEREAYELAEELGVSPARAEIVKRLSELISPKEKTENEISEGTYQVKNDGEIIEYVNLSGLSTRYYYTSQNITEGEVIEEIISNTQLKGMVDYVNVSNYIEKEEPFILGTINEDMKVLHQDEDDTRFIQDTAIAMNQPVEMPYIPVFDEAAGILLDVADGVVKIIDEVYNSETEYVRYAGAFRKIDVRVRIEPDIIWDITYIRHPGGMNNAGSRIYITQY